MSNIVEKVNVKDIILDLYNFLEKSEQVNSIYNIEFNQKDYKSYKCFECFKNIDWKKIFKQLISASKFLVPYVYSNDDIGQESTLSICIHDLSKIKNIDKYDIFNDDKFNFLMLKTKTMLVLFSINAISHKDINQLINENDLSLVKENADCFYRGHNDISYDLTPSIYRNYVLKCKNVDILKYDDLVRLYDEKGLIDKYEMIFKTRKIDYDFCSFMQHSCCYSPFLDITSDYKIALSFATCVDDKKTSRVKQSGALFKFKFNKKIKFISKVKLEDYTAFVVDRKFDLITYYKDKFLFECMPYDFNMEINVIYGKTNDRMKYQNGSFLYIKNAVIVNHNILIPYNVGRITKYNISSVEKENLKRAILSKCPQFSLHYLMNPYNFFRF